MYALRIIVGMPLFWRLSPCYLEIRDLPSSKSHLDFLGTQTPAAGVLWCIVVLLKACLYLDGGELWRIHLNAEPCDSLCWIVWGGRYDGIVWVGKYRTIWLSRSGDWTGAGCLYTHACKLELQVRVGPEAPSCHVCICIYIYMLNLFVDFQLNVVQRMWISLQWVQWWHERYYPTPPHPTPPQQ